MDIDNIPADRPVLIAGPTASGKSELALRIAEQNGGVIINADASQVYDCWRVVTARPSAQDESRAPHLLYGHLTYDAPYSAGHWLREVTPLLNGPERPIIVGGTGLYFLTLTEGMAEIPATPAAIRAEADQMSLEALSDALDDTTRMRIDMKNRARVQRAWEVLRATGRALADWQDDTPPPVSPYENCTALVVEADRDWLEARIRRRFSMMIANGALEEARAMQGRYNPNLPSCKAIGVPELMAHLNGDLSLAEAEESASVATRQYAKRQRTWFRSRMKKWQRVSPSP